MEISQIVNALLLFFALSMFFYLISLKLRNDSSEGYIEEEYNGLAKNPAKLAEPSEDALDELDKLLQKN